MQKGRWRELLGLKYMQYCQSIFSDTTTLIIIGRNNFAFFSFIQTDLILESRNPENLIFAKCFSPQSTEANVGWWQSSSD